MDTIYLDQAATTYPKPPAVAQAVYDYMVSNGASINRGCYARAYVVEEQVLETRQLLCDLLGGADCRCVLFTLNVTQSLNILLKGFLHPGDHVLVSAMEHNAVMRPLVQLQKQGISFTRIPCRPDGTLMTDSLSQALRPNTRLMVMTHASNVCGTVLPIAQMGAFCHAHGLRFFVDCAQSAGVLPIDMAAMHIDAAAFTGHKGLYGPQGIGGFVLTEELAAEIDPLLSGGTGSLSHTEDIPNFLPDRFEPGTPNLPGILGLRQGLLFLRETGLDAIRAHELSLTAQFLCGIAPLVSDGQVRLLGLPGTTGRIGVVSVQLPGQELAQAAYTLETQFGILTRVGLHCAPAAHRTLCSYPTGSIRFSFGWYNTAEQVETAAAALREVCHGA